MRRRTTDEVIRKLKQHIFYKHNYKNISNVKEKTIDKELGVSTGTVARWVYRDKIPSDPILDYCVQENIDPRVVLFTKKV